MDFSNQLIQLRKSQGLSQEELAGRLGVSRQAVSKWETGDALPDLQKAILLSQTLGVSMDRLCGSDLPEAPPEPEKPAASGKGFTLRRWLFAVMLLSCLLLGSLIGVLVSSPSGEQQTTPPAEAPAALPDIISVSGTWFATSDGELIYRFVPSVAGDGYTYQITFTGLDGNPHIIDAPCAGGVCSGIADISEYDSYAVNVLISNGTESRSVAIAYDMSYSISNGYASWK